MIHSNKLITVIVNYCLHENKCFKLERIQKARPYQRNDHGTFSTNKFLFKTPEGIFSESKGPTKLNHVLIKTFLHIYIFITSERSERSSILAVIYGSACRHLIASKTFKKNRKNVR